MPLLHTLGVEDFVVPEMFDALDRPNVCPVLRRVVLLCRRFSSAAIVSLYKLVVNRISTPTPIQQFAIIVAQFMTDVDWSSLDGMLLFFTPYPVKTSLQVGIGLKDVDGRYWWQEGYHGRKATRRQC